MSAFDGAATNPAEQTSDAATPTLARSLATLGVALFTLLEPSDLDGAPTATVTAATGDDTDETTSAFGAIDPLTVAQADDPKFVADDIRALDPQEAEGPLLRASASLDAADSEPGDTAATVAMLRAISFLDD